MIPRQSGACAHVAVTRAFRRLNAPARMESLTQSKTIRQNRLFSHLWNIILLTSILPYAYSGVYAYAYPQSCPRPHNAADTNLLTSQHFSRRYRQILLLRFTVFAPRVSLQFLFHNRDRSSEKLLPRASNDRNRKQSQVSTVR